jgi:hypothetical protein
MIFGGVAAQLPFSCPFGAPTSGKRLSSGLEVLAHIALLPVRLIFGHDVFISYARADGSRYAGGLAHALDAMLHVRIDTQQTRSGLATPLPEKS